jgi:hypothetical protein
MLLVLSSEEVLDVRTVMDSLGGGRIVGGEHEDCVVARAGIEAVLLARRTIRTARKAHPQSKQRR